jgi:hypothetical protein
MSGLPTICSSLGLSRTVLRPLTPMMMERRRRQPARSSRRCLNLELSLRISALRLRPKSCRPL